MSASPRSNILRVEDHVARLEEMAKGLPVSPQRQRTVTPNTRIEVVADTSELSELRNTVADQGDRIQQLERTVRDMMQLFQLSGYEMQLANESLDPAARVKCLHSLPSFSYLIRELGILAATQVVPIPVPVVPIPVPSPMAIPVPPPMPVMPPPIIEERIPSIIGADLGEDHRGVRVVSVAEGGPCELAGVYANDVIRSIESHPVVARSDMRGLLASYAPGTIITMIIERHGSLITLPIMLGSAVTHPWTPRRSTSPSRTRSCSPNRKY